MRKFASFALIVATIAAPCQALADNCRAVTVKQQVVSPFYAQAYNQVIVPQAFQVQVAAPFYMGVSDDYRQANFAAQVAQEYAKIVEIQRQQFNLAQGNGLPGQPLPVPPYSPKSTQSSKIGLILAKSCVVCHSPTGRQAEPDLSGNPDQIPVLVRLKAFASVARNEMPKAPHPPLPQDEFNELGAWSKLKPIDLIPQAIPAPPVLPKKEALPLPPVPEKLDKDKK